MFDELMNTGNVNDGEPFIGLSVISWAKLMQNESILDTVADQTRLVHTLGV